VLAGTFIYRSARGRAVLSAGSLLIGQQSSEFSCSHEYSCGDRCISFTFDESWVEDFVRELPGVRSARISHVRVPPVQSLVGLIADVQALADGFDIQGSEELAMRMAATAMTFSQAGPKLPDATRADERRIAAVLRNLEEEAAYPLSLDRLAGTAGMSTYHFLRVFQRVTGQTPWRFILSRRLALAARHLAEGRGTVLEAAVASGFTDLSEFTRQFRRHIGVTPGVYCRDRRRPSN